MIAPAKVLGHNGTFKVLDNRNFDCPGFSCAAPSLTAAKLPNEWLRQTSDANNVEGERDIADY